MSANRSHVFLTLAFASALFLAATTAQAAFVMQWQVGTDNNSNSEFGQEANGATAAPGSATVKDDDWYFAGTYPTPIGTLAANETTSNYERALTTSDPTDRIHFNLPADKVDAAFEYRLIIDTVSNNTGVPTNPIPFTASFNGVQVFSGSVSATAQTFTSPVFLGADVIPTTDENILTLNRSTTTGAGWMQFDFIRLEVQVPEPSAMTGTLIGATGLLMGRRVRHSTKRRAASARQAT